MPQGDAHWERRPVLNWSKKSITVTTATTTAAGSAATVTAATTAAVFTTGTAITAGALFFRTRDVDREGTVAEAGAVHGFNRLLGFFGGGHGDEGKSA